MAEEREASEPLTGFERYETSVLLSVRKMQENGFLEVLRHQEAGTVDVRRKPGAATPREAGQTIDMLYTKITLELQRRGAME